MQQLECEPEMLKNALQHALTRIRVLESQRNELLREIKRLVAGSSKRPQPVE